MLPPDYSRSLLALMASLHHGMEAIGEAPAVEPLAELPPTALAGRDVLLWVIDGLGDRLLREFPDSWLARHRTAVIDSVFPTTTVAAMSSYYTAAAPARHAASGWHMWLRELASVAAILPFRHRSGGTLERSGVKPASLFGADPLSARLPRPVHAIAPAAISDSIISRTLNRDAQRHGEATLEGFGARLASLLGEASPPRYLFAYWSELDALAHGYGCRSPEVSAHFCELDAAAARLAEACRASGAALIICADHGLIDSPSEHRIDLAAHPRLADSLTLPLCGEPRTAFAYPRARRTAEFLAYVEGELGQACEVHESEALIAQGWFGPGPVDRRLASRVGEYTLLMRDDWSIVQHLPGERPYALKAVHGGLSEAELKIPLIAQL